MELEEPQVQRVKEFVTNGGLVAIQTSSTLAGPNGIKMGLSNTASNGLTGPHRAMPQSKAPMPWRSFDAPLS